MKPLSPDFFEPEFEMANEIVMSRWLQGFFSSEHADTLSDSEKDHFPEVISDLTWNLLHFRSKTPDTWDPASLQDCLLIDYPRSVIKDDEYFEVLPGILSSFFTYLEETGLLVQGKNLNATVDECKVSFFNNLDDPRHWGPKKAFLYLAHEQGTDTTDPKAVNSFIRKFITMQAPGEDEKTSQSLSDLLYYWIFPFSDSKQIASLNPEAYTHAAGIIGSLISGLTIGHRLSPCEWTAPDITRALSKDLISHHRAQKNLQYLIPVLHSFFLFLDEYALQPHAGEIADELQALNNSGRISKEPDPMDDITTMLIKACIEAGISPDEKEAMQSYLKEHAEELIRDYLSHADEKTRAALQKKNSGLV